MGALIGAFSDIPMGTKLLFVGIIIAIIIKVEKVAEVPKAAEEQQHHHHLPKVEHDSLSFDCCGIHNCIC